MKLLKLKNRAFTLTETLMATSVAGLVMAGTASSFTQCLRQTQWAAYSFAANSLALQRLEQTRAAKWDRMASPTVDALVSSNFLPDVQVLDIPMNTTNSIYATNFTTISTVGTSPALKMIRVDCTWRFMDRGLFTNTIVAYRAPDQ